MKRQNDIEMIYIEIKKEFKILRIAYHWQSMIETSLYIEVI